MACCGKKRAPNNTAFSVMGGYKYLTDAQINARLEVFKRIYCKSCGDRYNCTFEVYNNCILKPRIK